MTCTVRQQHEKPGPSTSVRAVWTKQVRSQGQVRPPWCRHWCMNTSLGLQEEGAAAAPRRHQAPSTSAPGFSLGGGRRWRGPEGRVPLLSGARPVHCRCARADPTTRSPTIMPNLQRLAEGSYVYGSPYAARPSGYRRQGCLYFALFSSFGGPIHRLCGSATLTKPKAMIAPVISIAGTCNQHHHTPCGRTA